MGHLRVLQASGLFLIEHRSVGTEDQERDAETIQLAHSASFPPRLSAWIST